VTVERLALLLFWCDSSGMDEKNAANQWAYRLTDAERAEYLARAVRELTARGKAA